MAAVKSAMAVVVVLQPEVRRAAQCEGFGVVGPKREQCVEVLDGSMEIAELAPAKAAAQERLGVVRLQADALVIVVNGVAIAAERIVEIGRADGSAPDHPAAA